MNKKFGFTLAEGTPCFGMSKNVRRSAFTLAEVLITLGIIGVVAAMTIPTLIANTNSAKFRSQFKKSISTLNQAALMAQAQYDIDYSTFDDDDPAVCDASATPEGRKASGNTPAVPANYSICAIFNGTLSGASILNYAGLSTTYTVANKDGGTPAANTPIPKNVDGGAQGLVPNSADTLYVKMADTSMLAFNGKANNCSKDIGVALDGDWVKAHPTCIGFIDVNGLAMPNKEVTCNTPSDTEIGNSSLCEVDKTANHMTDIYPIAFHDSTVEPLTNAARYVLTTSK